MSLYEVGTKFSTQLYSSMCVDFVQSESIYSIIYVFTKQLVQFAKQMVHEKGSQEREVGHLDLLNTKTFLSRIPHMWPFNNTTLYFLPRGN